MQKELIKKVINRAWGIVVTNPQTWDEIVAQKESIDDTRKNYLYPLILIAVFCSFVFNALYAQNRALESAVLGAITTLIACGGSYFVANSLCFNYLKKYRPELASRANCELLVCYSYTIFLLLNILTSIIPSLSFLLILNLFVVYVLWNGCNAVWHLKEEDRGNVVLVFSLIIFLCPLLIKIVLETMISSNL